MVVTDSGGIQEETTVMGVPCLTFRDSTERPVTVTEGTNQVIGADPVFLAEAVRSTLSAPPRGVRRLEAWDGRASSRILNRLTESIPTRRASTDD